MNQQKRLVSWIFRRFHLGKALQTDPVDENLCVVQKETNDLEMEVRRVVQPKENDVLIRVGSVCICNDLANNFQLYAQYQQTREVKRPSFVVGNLAAGVVTKTGAGSSGVLAVGDRVVMEPGVSCFQCQFCLSGRTHLCSTISYIGTSARDGALCKFMTHPAFFCHKVEKNVSLDFAALTTKVACAVYCYQKANITGESKVLIIGSSLLGLVTLMVLKHLGVGSVIVAEVSNYRLEVAKKLGADFVLKISPKYSPEYPEYLREVMHAIYSEPPDITIDALGTTFSLETSFHMTKKGGKIILMTAQQSAQAPFLYATIRELKVIGCYSYTRESFIKALNIINDEVLPLSSLTTIRIPLHRAIDAFSYQRATERENIFTIVRNYETEKDKYFKESGGGEMKTAAIPRDLAVASKPLDKNTIRDMHENVRESVKQTISELTETTPERSEMDKQNKQNGKKEKIELISKTSGKPVPETIKEEKREGNESLQNKASEQIPNEKDKPLTSTGFNLNKNIVPETKTSAEQKNKPAKQGIENKETSSTSNPEHNQTTVLTPTKELVERTNDKSTKNKTSEEKGSSKANEPPNNSSGSQKN